LFPRNYNKGDILKRLIYFTLILTIFVLGNLVPLQAQTSLEQEELIVVVDEAHLQFIGLDLLQTAFAGLNDTFDNNQTDYTIRVFTNQEKFDSTHLQGADLLIIPNPGIDKTLGSDHNVESDEVNVLDTFVEQGKSILYLANPFSYNESIAGHALPINELLIDDFGAQLTLGGVLADTDNTTILVNAFQGSNDGNATHVRITGNHLEPQTLATEINEINEILYYGSSLNVISRDRTRLLGNTSNTYSVDQTGEAREQEIGQIKWLSGAEVNDNGKVILMGSTIMFSDLAYDETSKWIDQQDNLGFFENLIAFLLNVTPLDPPQESVQDSFSYLLRVNILAATLILLVFLSTIMGILIFTKRLSFDKIFAVRGARKRSTSKQKPGEEASSAKKKTPAKKKTKKRRKRT